VNWFAIHCLRDQNLSVEQRLGRLTDHRLPPDKHQITDRRGITYDGHTLYGSQALWITGSVETRKDAAPS
jgi:hypothetical protein